MNECNTSGIFMRKTDCAWQHCTWQHSAVLPQRKTTLRMATLRMITQRKTTQRMTSLVMATQQMITQRMPTQRMTTLLLVFQDAWLLFSSDLEQRNVSIWWGMHAGEICKRQLLWNRLGHFTAEFRQWQLNSDNYESTQTFIAEFRQCIFLVHIV